MIDHEILKEKTENYSKSTLFPGLVNINAELLKPEFYKSNEFNSNKVEYRERIDDSSIIPRAGDRCMYGHVLGASSTVDEFVDKLFDPSSPDLYSLMGASTQFLGDDNNYGKYLYDKITDAIVDSSWYNLENTLYSGEIFIGKSSIKYGDPEDGHVGTLWHMDGTSNLYIQVVGTRKWYFSKPIPGHQVINPQHINRGGLGMVAPPTMKFDDYYEIEMHPGDVMYIPPSEWHKVFLGEGPCIGATLRPIDLDYLFGLEDREYIDKGFANRMIGNGIGLVLSSLKQASMDQSRANVMLNDAEWLTSIIYKQQLKILALEEKLNK